MKFGSNKEDGYTLVESLVAFAILSGCTILALSAMADGLRRMKHASHIADATTVARDAYANFITHGQDQNLVKGENQGMHWQITKSRIGLPPGDSLAAATDAWLLTVTITNIAGKNIPQATFRTIVVPTPGR